MARHDDPDDEEIPSDGSDEVVLKKSKGKKRKSDAGGSPKPKKTMPAPESEEKSNPTGTDWIQIETNNEGDPYFNISKLNATGLRRVTARTFKNALLIDLREFYNDKNTGEVKPGSKGISLSPEQWEVLKNNIGVVDRMIQQVKGE